MSLPSKEVGEGTVAKALLIAVYNNCICPIQVRLMQVRTGRPLTTWRR